MTAASNRNSEIGGGRMGEGDVAVSSVSVAAGNQCLVLQQNQEVP